MPEQKRYSILLGVTSILKVKDYVYGTQVSDAWSIGGWKQANELDYQSIIDSDFFSVCDKVTLNLNRNNYEI